MLYMIFQYNWEPDSNWADIDRFRSNTKNESIALIVAQNKTIIGHFMTKDTLLFAGILGDKTIKDIFKYRILWPR